MIIKERIFNIETGETVDLEREETAAEKSTREARQAEIAAELAEAQTMAEAKAAAQAKLTALGLTIEDLTALGLGSN